MVDSKFLIVTTLCYVGIFGVIFIVCCCAWNRHLRKERRGLSPRQRNTQTNRRFYITRPTQPPEYHAPSTPMQYGVQQRYEFAEEVQNVTAGKTYFPLPQRTDNIPQRNNLYPIVAHYPNPVFAGYPLGNLNPSRGVTTGTHAVQITTCGDSSRYSGDDFSDATSSRFDGGDSSFANMDEKNPTPLTRARSRSTDSEKEAESDVSSSEASHLQEITTLREQRC